MKRIITSILSIALALSLAACGSSNGSTTITASSVTESTSAASAAVATAAPTQEPTAEPKSTFEEQTIVDNEYCTVILKDIDEDGMWGYSWKVYLENKTDKELMFGMDNVSVNGVMADPFWATTVAAGKKSNDTISWMSNTLEANNIKPDDITQVTFTLKVYDNDNWTADKYVNDEFTIYPKGEENATSIEREAQDTDIILFDNDSCSMTVTGFDPEGAFGYTVNVYLVNKTDEDLMFSANDVSIDGFMCDPFWATTVAAGKSSNDTISWFDNSLEEAGIDKASIKEIELPITVYPSESWTSSKIINDTYTINAQ